MANIQDSQCPNGTIEVIAGCTQPQAQNVQQEQNISTIAKTRSTIYHCQDNSPLLGNKSRHSQAGFYSKVKSKFKSRQCCLWSSKAALIILVCNLIVSFGLVSLLDPSWYSVVLVLTAENYASSDYTFSTIILGVTYGASALLLLFYPLAGYLADVRWGRHKTVINSLCFTFWCVLLMVVLSGLGALGFIPLLTDTRDGTKLDSVTIINIMSSVVFLLPLFCGAVILLCSLVAFSANVIQYGIDQLHDAPTDASVLYIHWYVWTAFFGLFVVRLPFIFPQIFAYLFPFTILLSLLLLGIMLCVYNRFKGTYFLIESGCRNPYKLVFKVFKFAKEHSYPIRRSAFTYCEDELPSRLDLGKEKYGGPFTTEEVENVKVFVGILCVLLTTGPTFLVDVAGNGILPVMSEDDSEVHVTDSGCTMPLMIIVILPFYLGLLRPFIHTYVPGMLKRMGLGMVLLFTSCLSTLVMGLFGTSCVITNSTSCESMIFAYPNIDMNYIMIQNTLNAVGYMLFYIASYEFICAQSPHSMKGLLIGTFFAIKGVFQLIGVLAVYVPVTVWCKSNDHTFPVCGFVYYLINAVIALIGLIAFTYTARKYQYRQRDEPDNIYRYAEEYYDNAQDEPNYDYDNYDNLKCETITVTVN